MGKSPHFEKSPDYYESGYAEMHFLPCVPNKACHEQCPDSRKHAELVILFQVNSCKRMDHVLELCNLDMVHCLGILLPSVL